MTRTVTRSSRAPVPNQTYLNLRAVRRRAQHQACKSGTCNAWSAYNNVLADFSHVFVLNATSDVVLWVTGIIYSLYNNLENYSIFTYRTSIHNPYSCMPIATNRSLPELTEAFAAEFTCPIPGPSYTNEHVLTSCPTGRLFLLRKRLVYKN